MAWFKVDDGLHDHRKARKVRRSHSSKRRDAAPFGIWVLAGSWAGANGTSGFVPTEVLEEWDDDALDLAERLVDAGLWWATVEHGEPGYGFHDWEVMNPSSDPRTTPKDASESGAFGNHVRWHVEREKNDPDCEHCDRGDSPPDVAPMSGGESRSGRSRPVPSRPELPSASATAEREFDEFWAAYPRKKDKGHGVKAYRSARKHTSHADIIDALERDKDSTWNQRAAEFIPYPASWLNSHPWEDEPDAPTRAPYPTSGTDAEKDAWARSIPLPVSGWGS